MRRGPTQQAKENSQHSVPSPPVHIISYPCRQSSHGEINIWREHDITMMAASSVIPAWLIKAKSTVTKTEKQEMKDTSNSLSASACNGESERAKEQEMKDKSTPSIASDCYEKSEGAKEQEMKDTSAPLDAFDGEKKSEGALAPDLSVEQRRKNRRVARRRQQKRRKQRLKEEKNENKVRRFEKLVTERALKMEADLLETMEAERKNAAKYLSLARKYYGMWKATNEELQLFRQYEKASIAEGDYSTSKKVKFRFHLVLKSITVKLNQIH